MRKTARTKYATTTSHVRYACENPDVSDPFMLWNDDFYAIQPVPHLETVHRGELAAVVARYKTMTGAWGDGLRATAATLAALLPGQVLFSYEVHVPIVVHKAAMLEALDVAAGIVTVAPHKRTLYGNLARLGGVQVRDPKVTRQTATWPAGPWLSSDDTGFSTAVAPRLRRLFPTVCRYETGR